jgi:hypothetical protein
MRTQIKKQARAVLQPQLQAVKMATTKPIMKTSQKTKTAKNKKQNKAMSERHVSQ